MNIDDDNKDSLTNQQSNGGENNQVLNKVLYEKSSDVYGLGMSLITFSIEEKKYKLLLTLGF